LNFKLGDLVIAEDIAHINGKIGRVIEIEMPSAWPIRVRFPTISINYTTCCGHRISPAIKGKRIVKATKLHKLLEGVDDET